MEKRTESLENTETMCDISQLYGGNTAVYKLSKRNKEQYLSTGNKQIISLNPAALTMNNVLAAATVGITVASTGTLLYRKLFASSQK